MAIRLSTGCAQALAQHKTVRELFHDGALLIYSGTQPASADDGVGGSTLLATIAVEGLTFTPGTKSTPLIEKVTVTSDTGTSYTITIGSAEYSYTKQGGDTTTTIARGLAAVISDNDINYRAAWDGSSGIILTERFPAYAATASVSVGANLSKTTLQSAIRAGGIHWGEATGGILNKEAATWKGTVTTAGTAGWFRIVGNAADSGGASTTLPRIDGSISTVSGDMILANVVLAQNDTISITTATLTIPKQ